MSPTADSIEPKPSGGIEVEVRRDPVRSMPAMSEPRLAELTATIRLR